LLILLGVTFVTPVPALVFAGQEHLAHILLNLLFLDLAVRSVADDVPAGDRPRLRWLVVLAAVLPMVRYEGLYPCVLVGALFILKRRWRDAAVIGFAAAAPVVAYAAISVAHGWLLAPNSVLIKASLPSVRSAVAVADLFGYSALSSLWRLRPVMFLVCAAIVLFFLRWRAGFWERRQLLLAIFLGLTALQLQFSQPRSFWLFRYEAYVITLGVVAAGIAAERLLRERLDRSVPVLTAVTAVLVLIVAASPLRERAVRAVKIVPRAVKNIYEQQYQMGRFLQRYYEGRTVAMNDIGAATFLADFKCVDLVGLASMDVARKKLAGYYVAQDVEEVVRDHGSDIAIVYDYQLRRRGGVPPSWWRAGSWTIKRNVVVGNATVVFYAMDAGELPVLVANLRAFSRELPRGVTARIAGG
jgi:hypothetical protein